MLGKDLFFWVGALSSQISCVPQFGYTFVGVVFRVGSLNSGRREVAGLGEIHYGWGVKVDPDPLDEDYSGCRVVITVGSYVSCTLRAAFVCMSRKQKCESTGYNRVSYKVSKIL